MAEATTESWLVIHLETGALDGFYRRRADAEGSRDRRANETPGHWLVVSVDSQRNPLCPIPDHMIWNNRLKDNTTVR